MGEYVYRRTSRVSELTLPSGERISAVHLAFAYKPFHSWSGAAHNKRMNALATAHVTNANNALAARGL